MPPERNEEYEKEQDFDAAFDQAIAGADGGAVAEGGSQDSGSEEESQEASSESEQETAGESEGEGTEGTGEAEGEETEGTGGGEGGEPEGEETGETEGAGEGTGEAAEGQRQLSDEELARIADNYRQRVQQEGQQGQGQGQGEGQEQEQQGAQSWEDFVSEDDLNTIKQYEEEWPEVARAEQVKRDAQLQYMREQIYSEMGDALAPVVEMYQQMKVDAHQQAIQQRHPDVDNIKDDLVGWVEQQPDFVKPTYQQVLQQGSAEQVNQLIDLYKQSSGRTGAGAESTASSAREQGGEQQGQQRQQRQRKAPSQSAQRAMAATPKPKRSEPPKAKDPNDFDDAFEEAIESVGGL